MPDDSDIAGILGLAPPAKDYEYLSFIYALDGSGQLDNPVFTLEINSDEQTSSILTLGHVPQNLY